MSAMGACSYRTMMRLTLMWRPRCIAGSGLSPPTSSTSSLQPAQQLSIVSLTCGC